jgi:hypothetical protein
MSISQYFAEKGSKRESQAISSSAPAADAAVGEAKPSLENGKVTPPRRLANRERRTREHLTPQEVDRLISPGFWNTESRTASMSFSWQW